MFKTVAMVLLVLIVFAGSLLAAENPQIKSLVASIEKQCEEQGVPGLAIVVVKDNEVVLKHCFGYADPAKKIPVDPQTIFPVGSMSKPFTSILAAALVSDGELSWDDPITKSLPWFQLPIKTDDAEDQVTIRDLLSHRTGFFTMHLIQEGVNWAQLPDYEPPFDRIGIMRAMMTCAPDTNFRASHNYSNVSMVAVAEACAKISGKSWDDLLNQRLLKPLGMNHTGSVSADLLKRENVAIGHMPGPDGVGPVKQIDMDCIAPAGGVWSNIDDLTHWLKFLLAEGENGKDQLVSAQAINDTWTEHIHDANIDGQFPGARYGLGWFLTETHGHQVIEHAGNALGYSANLAMIPSENVGYILISNVLPCPLQIQLNDEVWQALGVFY